MSEPKSVTVDGGTVLRVFEAAAVAFFADSARASDDSFAVVAPTDAIALTLLARAVGEMLGLTERSLAAGADELLRFLLEQRGETAESLVVGYVRRGAECRRHRTESVRARRGATVQISTVPGGIQIVTTAANVERVTTIERDDARLIKQTRTRDVPIASRSHTLELTPPWN